MTEPTNPAVLSITGGHRVQLDAFFAMMQSVASELNARWSHSIQPDAQRWLRGDTPFDAVVMHDLPGLALKRGTPPTPIDPSEETRAGLRALTDRGVGLVVMHHALAGWPSWDGWADALGGRFSYAPGTRRGATVPSSGTRLDRFTITPTQPHHPVCDGVEPFAVDDEPYHCPIDEDRVVALCRSDVDTDGVRFISTFEHVLVGESNAPNCAGLGRGSDLVVWASSAGSSPIVVIQPGDSGTTFELPMYRRLLRNAISWVLSPDAREWASERSSPLDCSIP